LQEDYLRNSVLFLDTETDWLSQGEILLPAGVRRIRDVGPGPPGNGPPRTTPRARTETGARCGCRRIYWHNILKELRIISLCI